VLGLFFGALAVFRFFAPSASGDEDHRMLTRIAISIFGPRGEAFLPLLASWFFFYVARFFWRKTPKTPNDRLWW
jgi:hypothetical protein